jgi:Uma2 family endonuclease
MRTPVCDSIYDEAMATTTLLSFADFERLEQGADKIELLKGELIRMPPAQNDHMDTCEFLFELLKADVNRARAAGARLGKVHIERGYRLAGDPASWLQPDVSVTHPDQPIDRYYLGAPLIAFEVVSEFDKAPELNAKVLEYLANGAGEVWLIYPQQRDAWVYDGTGTARHETRSIHTALLPGIDIPLDQIL